MRSIPAALVAVLLVFPLFLAAFVTIGVSTWALDRHFYARLIGDERLYEIPAGPGAEGWLSLDVPVVGGLPLSAAGAAMKEIVTPAYLRAQALGLLDEAFDLVEGRGPGFDPSLDLTPIKKALSGDAGTRFARAFAKELPVCTGSRDFAVVNGKLPTCRPSTISVDKAAAIIAAGLPSVVKAIPDTLRLSDAETSVALPHPWGAGRPFNAMGFLVLGDLVLLAIAAGLWVAAAFIGGANLRERLMWFGWTLFAPAVLVFMAGLAIAIGAGSEWVRYGLRQAQLESFGFGPGFTDAVYEAARFAATRVATGFLATGAIAAGIALGLLAWGWTSPGAEAKNEGRQTE